MKALVFFGVLALLIENGYSQATTITYQGRLADSTEPANGVYDLRFTIYDALTDGNALGSITNASTAVSNGLFTVQLDFGANTFDGGARWVEIGVRPGGDAVAYTVIDPRQSISSAPYAIQAANAASATSVSGTVAASQLTGTISSNNFGAGSITTTMLANGAVGAAQLATGAVTTATLADGAVNLAKLQTVLAAELSLVFTNPTPAIGDFFGSAVAAIGSDRLLIGAESDDAWAVNAGAAYLFSTNGALLTTFTNPAAASGDFFGRAVAVVSTNRVLIGADSNDTEASNAGAAYLFDTSGTLLTTFTNPTPAVNDFFGQTLAAVGTDRVLIGAPDDDTGATDTGAAYLFSTDGTLLTTFTNPTPAAADRFARALTAVGTNAVLIGAYSDNTGATDTGAAYLFSTEGTLLTTFTNPTAKTFEEFGRAVAALDTERVLIGTYQNARAAYLFHTNGTRLATFTNPSPALNDRFGHSLAAVGTDRVLIAAPLDDAGGTDAGVAYLYSTNGTLLTTFTKLFPAASDQFGHAVAAVGTGRVLIAALRDDKGANDAGTAHLFRFNSSYVPGLISDGVVDGRVINGTFTGNGSGLSDLSASQITGGILSDALLSTNIAKLNATQTFTGQNTIRSSGSSRPLQITDGANGNISFQTLSGGNSGYHSINFNGYYSGSTEERFNTNKNRWRMVVDQRGSSDVFTMDVHNGVSGSSLITVRTNGNVGIGGGNPTEKLHVVGNALVTGTMSGTFSGNGAALTSLNASQLTSGTVPDARLSANVVKFDNGTLRVDGLLRSGSENGTAEAPSPAGLVVRRINSTVTTTNSVVAVVEGLSQVEPVKLVRDGTDGGFQIHFPPDSGNLTIACTGMDNTGATKNFYFSTNAVEAGVVQIYANSENIVHFKCTFGNTVDSGKHLTEATLTRFFPDTSWSGHITSTYNQ